MPHHHHLKSLFAPLLIVLVGALTYANSVNGVFVYDDLDSIRDNPHIRMLWPLSEAMSLPLWSSAATVDGRPLLSLTFALNHRFLGADPWGYHVINLLIHILAGLLLFGVVRRTLRLSLFGDRVRRDATGVSLATAALWVVHPLQTESVTYIVQRAESLMGMLYLLTMYCAIRAFTTHSGVKNPPSGDGGYDAELSSRSRARQRVDGRLWIIASVTACALGMGVKQTMVSAPVLVLLFDGIFVSDSIRAALAKRRGFYMALFSTWTIVLAIIAASWQESTIDFVTINPVRYLLTQPLVILNYLRLSLWPSPLILDYGWALEREWHRIVLPGLAVLGLLLLMIRGIRRRAWYGFVSAWFFLILAPTSSIAPTRQAMVEHRMYLPLAAVVILVVIISAAAGRKLFTAARHRSLAGACLIAVTVLVLGGLTYDRNKDYLSEVRIWQHTVTHRPGNALAHLNLGNALQAAARPQDAVVHYREALRLEPDYAEAYYNLGVALGAMGQMPDAIKHYRRAVEINPDYAEAHNNLAHALQAAGNSNAAVTHGREALRINPGLPDAYFNLANALQALGQSREAVEHYREALRLKPGYAEAHLGWGNVWLTTGRVQDAIAQYQQALALKPDYASAHYHWGIALDAAQQPREAMFQYQQAVRLQPDLAEAHLNLGNAVLRMGDPRGAITHYERALRIRPGFTHARENLDIAMKLVVESGGRKE